MQVISTCRVQLHSTPNASIGKSKLRRGLFMVGLIFRYFDFRHAQQDDEGFGSDQNTLPSFNRNNVLEHLLFFSQLGNQHEIRREALLALGRFCSANFDFVTDSKLRGVYRDVLTSDQCGMDEKTNILHNISMCLSSATASDISLEMSRLFLDEVLHGFFDVNENIRSSSMDVVQRILRHGSPELIPKIVPFLICLSTDENEENANRANHQLQIIKKQYLKLGFDMQLPIELQTILQNRGVPKMKIARGFTIKDGKGQPTATALNTFVLYTLSRRCVNDRKLLADSIIDQFDAEYSKIAEMVYLADNLACFPYAVRDEPLYVLARISQWIDQKTFAEPLEGGDHIPTDRKSTQVLNLSSKVLKKFCFQFQAENICCGNVLLTDCGIYSISILLNLQEHLQALYNIKTR